MLSPEGGVAITLIGAMLVLLATAGMVWRQDRLAVVPAVLVVTAHALTVLVHSLVRVLGSPSAVAPYPPAGAVDVLVQAAALGVLAAAAVRLTLAAKNTAGRPGRHRRLSEPSRGLPGAEPR